jgi:hypothetical protein
MYRIDSQRFFPHLLAQANLNIHRLGDSFREGKLYSSAQPTSPLWLLRH